MQPTTDFSSPSSTGLVRKFQHHGYTIHMKEDGYDYLNVFTQLDDIKASAVKFATWNARHEVFKFDFQGRTFVAKIDPEHPKYFENKVWELITGPFYSTQMKAVNKAIRKGCTVVPDIFLVAEKKRKGVRCESIIVMEYVPGRSLCAYEENLNDYEGIVLQAMMELHSHGLALGDANCGNYIINEGTCKILDLSWHGASLLGQAKDRLILERVYGWHLPATTFLQKMAGVYIRLKRTIQHRLSPRKRKRPNR